MAFSDNVWWTRKSRIQAEKRLISNAHQSQLLLLWYSIFGVAVSIYFLKDQGAVPHDQITGIIWVVYSVLMLSISSFVTALSFKDRASLVKNSYEALQDIYLQSKKAERDEEGKQQINDLVDRYKNVMAISENHIEYDYYIALCKEHDGNYGKINEITGCKDGLDKCPTWYHRYRVVEWKLRRTIMFFFLYSSPIFLLLF